MIAQDVYVLAMKLMGEDSEDGTDDGYTVEYQQKAWGILTILQSELLPPTTELTPVTSGESELQTVDRVSRMILPYGLAAHLLMDEDQNKSVFFNARYDELKRKNKALLTPIKDVYNVVSSMNY